MRNARAKTARAIKVAKQARKKAEQLDRHYDEAMLAAEAEYVQQQEAQAALEKVRGTYIAEQLRGADRDA